MGKPNHYSIAELDHSYQKILDIIGSLPEREQEVYLLFLLTPSVETVSASLGITTTEARGLFRRGRARLREVWRSLHGNQSDSNARLYNYVDNDDDMLLNEVLTKSEFESRGSLTEPLSPSPPSSPSFEERSRHLDALIATMPKDAAYSEQVQGLLELNHDFRREIAIRLEPVLNAQIHAMPHDDLDGKQKICQFVNCELERFGLAVQCPKTGLPAKLKATSGNWPGKGSFFFEVYIDGKRKKPSWSDTLPELQLIDATPSQVPETPKLASETPWQDEVGPKSAPRPRKLT
jgi:hypothetical protein